MRLLPGVASPLRNAAQHPIGMMCIRENSEGEYAGVGGRVHQGEAREVAIQTTVFTRSITERVMRFAFDYAQQHGHQRVTNVTKSNSMQYNLVFWDEVFQQVAAHYPSVTTDQQLVDSMTARMVSQPETVDLFVAPTCSATS